MSYILDALKKAESERNLGAVPSLHSTSPSTLGSENRTRTSGLPWILLAALTIIVILSAIIWQQLSKSGHRQENTAQSTPLVTNNPAPVEVLPTPTTEHRPPLEQAPKPNAPVGQSFTPENTQKPLAAVASHPADAARKITASVNKANQAQAGGIIASSASISASDKDAQAPVQTESTKIETKRHTSESIPGLNQLPAATRSEIPSLAVGGYLYSGNPSDRTILLNNKLLHEGDSIAPNLVLESLAPKSAVLSYKGTRFQITY